MVEEGSVGDLSGSFWFFFWSDPNPHFGSGVEDILLQILVPVGDALWSVDRRVRFTHIGSSLGITEKEGRVVHPARF